MNITFRSLAFFLAFFSFQISYSQTGFWNDFSGTDVSSWNPTSVNAFKPTVVNNQLQLVTTTSSYTNLEYKFSSQNIAANPKLRIKVISPSNFTMRIDLRDAAGNYTNSNPVSVSVTQSSTLKRYVLDFTGKFGAADASKIVQASIFFNAGGNFNGTVIFDDFVLGDSVKLSPIANVSGNILTNQIGYERIGSKTAILQSAIAFSDTISFTLKNANGLVVYKNKLGATQQVAGWANRNFRIADFSAFQQNGKYTLTIGSLASYQFEIADNLLFNKTASSVIDFFKGMRNTNAMDKTLSFNGPRNDAVDVSGGWSDASGDFGKHMSHLSYANYFNPQQIPMVAWSLMKAYEQNKTAFGTKATDVLAEAAFGADYLVKNTDKDGYLYIAIFDDWGGAPGSREICEWGQPNNGGSILNTDKARTANYQAAMREGAGIAIAALARAKRMNITVGASTPATYLAKAELLYNHLKSAGNGYATKNLEYCNDHKENIIDYYCGILAATELYRATQNAVYLQDAANYVTKLLSLQDAQGWLASDYAKNRPFYHAADEGMPLFVLAEYMNISNSKNTEIKTFAEKWIKWQYNLSTKVSNPFLYTRQNTKAWKYSGGLQAAKESFFVPQSNETEYWWQGENARLASLTASWVTISRAINKNYNIGEDSISQIAIAQLDWILGKNPFDVCMITGFGTKTYPPYNGKINLNGGICNGIAAGGTDETEIAWMPYDNSNANGDAWQNWRWVEQWLPHDSWYLLAVSAISDNVNNPYTDCNQVLGGSAVIDSCKKCAGGNTGIIPNFDAKKCNLTGFEDELDNTNMSFVLFPNPSRNQITIKSGLKEAFNVRIVNLDGKETAFYANFSNDESFDVSQFVPGLYSAIINYGNQTKFVKFAVTR